MHNFNLCIETNVGSLNYLTQQTKIMKNFSENSKAEHEENLESGAGNKEYLSELVNCLEKLIGIDKNLPFRIVDIKPNGFLVKISGLYGYISFQFMPWKYNKSAYWKVVFPTLKNKVFFCKVHQFTKDPLSIVLNAEIPQFRKAKLIDNELYKGIVINKANYGVFVDIGVHFHWQCGSLIGLLHKSNFDTPERFATINAGDEIKVFFWGINSNEEIILGCKTELTEWLNGSIDDLTGAVLPVRIVVDAENKKTEYLVDEKYYGTFPVTKTIYAKNCKRISNAIRLLKSNDIIHCEVLKTNKLKRTLQLKWDTKSEINEILSRNNQLKTISSKNKTRRLYDSKNDSLTLENRINQTIIEKLQLIVQSEYDD